MALNGTPYQFERMTVEVDGIGTVISHQRVNYRVQLGNEIVTDNIGWPRGEIEGDYTGTCEIELATQEAFESLSQLAQQGEDPLTVSFAYAPKAGSTATLTFFLRLQEFEGTEEKNTESMLTLTFLHADVMQVNGSPIKEDRRS